MFRPLLQSLRRRHMDISFRAAGGVRVQILERPGLWMEQGALEALSSDLRLVAGRTLAAGNLTYGVFSGRAEPMKRVIITIVRRCDGQAIAFNALAVMEVQTEPRPTEVLHLGLVMVDPDERSKNLSWLLYGLTCFLIFFRKKFRPVWVSNVTQVPAVVGMVATMFSDVWPAGTASRQSLTQRILARRIMAAHRDVFGVGDEAGFDEDRAVITNAYTGGSDDLKKTFEAAAKHRDATYNSFCEAELDYDRGDDLLQLGQLDMAALRRYLVRDVPRSAVFGLLLAGGLVALRRVVLPMLHWFDSAASWSILRPWRGE